MRAELDVLGLNVSAHPLAFARDQIDALGCTPFAKLAEVPDRRPVRLAGVLERAQMPWIRSGHRTLFLTLEDETELAQVVVFNDVYLQYGRVLKETVYFYVEGQLQNSEEHGLAVVAHRIDDLLAVLGRRPSPLSPGSRQAPSAPTPGSCPACSRRRGPAARADPQRPQASQARATRQGRFCSFNGYVRTIDIFKVPSIVRSRGSGGVSACAQTGADHTPPARAKAA